LVLSRSVKSAGCAAPEANADSLAIAGQRGLEISDSPVAATPDDRRRAVGHVAIRG